MKINKKCCGSKKLDSRVINWFLFFPFSHFNEEYFEEGRRKKKTKNKATNFLFKIHNLKLISTGSDINLKNHSPSRSRLCYFCSGQMPTKAQTYHKTSLSRTTVVGDWKACFLFKLLKGCCMVVFSVNRLFPVGVFRVIECTIAPPFGGPSRTFYPRTLSLRICLPSQQILSTATSTLTAQQRLDPGWREEF